MFWGASVPPCKHLFVYGLVSISVTDAPPLGFPPSLYPQEEESKAKKAAQAKPKAQTREDDLETRMG